MLKQGISQMQLVAKAWAWYYKKVFLAGQVKFSKKGKMVTLADYLLLTSAHVVSDSGLR